MTMKQETSSEQERDRATELGSCIPYLSDGSYYMKRRVVELASECGAIDHANAVMILSEHWEGNGHVFAIAPGVWFFPQERPYGDKGPTNVETFVLRDNRILRYIRSCESGEEPVEREPFDLLNAAKYVLERSRARIAETY